LELIDSIEFRSSSTAESDLIGVNVLASNGWLVEVSGKVIKHDRARKNPLPKSRYDAVGEP